MTTANEYRCLEPGVRRKEEAHQTGLASTSRDAAQHGAEALTKVWSRGDICVVQDDRLHYFTSF